MVNGIGTIYSSRLNKVFSSKFRVGSKIFDIVHRVKVVSRPYLVSTFICHDQGMCLGTVKNLVDQFMTDGQWWKLSWQS